MVIRRFGGKRSIWTGGSERKPELHGRFDPHEYVRVQDAHLPVVAGGETLDEGQDTHLF